MCLKRFYEVLKGLHKTFWGPQRNVVIKIKIFCLPGIGAERVEKDCHFIVEFLSIKYLLQRTQVFLHYLHPSQNISGEFSSKIFYQKNTRCNTKKILVMLHYLIWWVFELHCSDIGNKDTEWKGMHLEAERRFPLRLFKNAVIPVVSYLIKNLGFGKKNPRTMGQIDRIKL